MPATSIWPVAMAVILEPYLSQILRQANDVTAVSDFTEIAPSGGASEVPMVYSEGFAADRAAGEAFMLAYMRAVRLYSRAFRTGEGKEAIIALVAKRTGFSEDVVRESNPVGFEPNQEVNRDFLNKAQAFFVSQQMLSAPIDLDALLDPSFARATVAKLGPYAGP